MTKGLTVIIEVKQKWWFKPLTETIGFLYGSNLIPKKPVERLLGRLINRSFKFRMDKGKWQKLDVDMQYQIEWTN